MSSESTHIIVMWCVFVVYMIITTMMTMNLSQWNFETLSLIQQAISFILIICIIVYDVLAKGNVSYMNDTNGTYFLFVIYILAFIIFLTRVIVRLTGVGARSIDVSRWDSFMTTFVIITTCAMIYKSMKMQFTKRSSKTINMLFVILIMAFIFGPSLFLLQDYNHRGNPDKIILMNTLELSTWIYGSNIQGLDVYLKGGQWVNVSKGYEKSDLHERFGAVYNTDEGILYIAFPGTYSKDQAKINATIGNQQIDIKDYLHDKKDLLTANNGQPPRIHKGFYAAFMKLSKRLQETVHEAVHKNNVQKIVVCGHSLGGALATLTIPFLKSDDKLSSIPIDCYTFGSPAVGDKAFAELLFNKLVNASNRITNPYDPVVFGTKLQFRHVKGNYVVAMFGLQNFPGVAHTTGVYRKCLQKSRAEQLASIYAPVFFGGLAIGGISFMSMRFLGD